MLAIFEGIDKSGKTTLVEEVSRLLGSNVTTIHASKPKVHPIDEYERSLTDYAPATMTHMLLDRWHVGETVWPEIFDRKTDYDAAMHKHVELFLMSRGGLLVLAEARESALARRVDADDYFQPEQIPEILLRFKVAVKHSVLNRISYDFERDDVTDFAFSVIRGGWTLEHEANRVLDVTRGVIGFPRPMVLYVGEQVNDTESGDNIPFLPYKGTSGWHLMRSLPVEPLAICNALAPNGQPEDLKDLVKVMNYPRVVALGNVADRILIDKKVKHGVAPHPQYVRRFHKNALEGRYHDMLRRAGWGVDTRPELRPALPKEATP